MNIHIVYINKKKLVTLATTWLLETCLRFPLVWRLFLSISQVSRDLCVCETSFTKLFLWDGSPSLEFVCCNCYEPFCGNRGVRCRYDLLASSLGVFQGGSPIETSPIWTMSYARRKHSLKKLCFSILPYGPKFSMAKIPTHVAMWQIKWRNSSSLLQYPVFPNLKSAEVSAFLLCLDRWPTDSVDVTTALPSKLQNLCLRLGCEEDRPAQACELMKIIFVTDNVRRLRPHRPGSEQDLFANFSALWMLPSENVENVCKREFVSAVFARASIHRCVDFWWLFIWVSSSITLSGCLRILEYFSNYKERLSFIFSYAVSVIIVKYEAHLHIRTCVTCLGAKFKKREYISLTISDS